MGVVTILWGNNIVENQLECTQDPTVPLNNTSLHFSVSVYEKSMCVREKKEMYIK